MAFHLPGPCRRWPYGIAAPSPTLIYLTLTPKQVINVAHRMDVENTLTLNAGDADGCDMHKPMPTIHEPLKSEVSSTPESRSMMKLDDLLEYQTPEEAIEALSADLAVLVQKSRRARDAGDRNQGDILSTLISEDLDLIIDFLELENFGRNDPPRYPEFSG